MAIDEHPVHMVFGPVITRHPAIQDGEFWQGRRGKISPSWDSGVYVCWGGEDCCLLDWTRNTNGKAEGTANGPMGVTWSALIGKRWLLGFGSLAG